MPQKYIFINSRCANKREKITKQYVPIKRKNKYNNVNLLANKKVWKDTPGFRNSYL